MHTQCPHCQTIFRINAVQLNAAEGFARCKHCLNIFNASKQLVKEPSRAEKARASLTDEELADLPEDEAIPDLDDVFIPSRRHSLLSVIFWLGINVVMITALLGQYVWLTDRDRVLQHPQVRPLLDKFCHHLLCEVPITRNLSQIHMDSQVARPHADIKDVIQFDAKFSNQAQFPQPYPELLLTIEDVNGHPLAQRRFTPEAYLHQQDIDRVMQPGEVVHLQLEVVDQANIIENDKLMEGYKFDFI
jgi:predicted Zn finger-like uncharacterized protein